VWPGAVNQEILSNAREVRQSRGFSSTLAGYVTMMMKIIVNIINR